MPLAKDLNDLIHRYGSAIASAAESVLIPRHVPGNPLPDLSAIEACRSTQTGKLFRLYPSQKEKIAGALAGLKAKRRAWMICEMGCGKSPMSIATAWLLLKHRPFRLLVMCPGHLVRKWRREVEWAIPGVVCKVIRKFADLTAFEDVAKNCKAPMVAVIGKDTAKLGYDVDRPCAAKRRMKLRVRLDSTAEMQPGDTELREIPSEELKDAIKRRVNGKSPPGLAATRVQALDAFLDKPFGWEPIRAPAYDEDGNRCGTEAVAWPADLGENHADSKDEKLLETVQEELRQNRRCAIYPQFTGVHDVRQKRRDEIRNDSCERFRRTRRDESNSLTGGFRARGYFLPYSSPTQ